MSSITSISADEYLSTSYRPDREYLDGLVVERNVGERDHSWLQGEILFLLRRYRNELNLFAFPEQRIQVKRDRYRVPDISVTRGFPSEAIFTKPPFLCIEILSAKDTVESLQDRIDDYLAFQVQNIWLINPKRKEAFYADHQGTHQANDGILTAEGEPVSIDVNPLWPTASSD